MDPDCGYQTAGSHCYPGFGFILKCRCIENPRRGSAKLAQPVSFSPSSLPQQFEVAEEEPSRPLRRLLCRVRWSRVEGHAGQDRPIGPKKPKGSKSKRSPCAGFYAASGRVEGQAGQDGYRWFGQKNRESQRARGAPAQASMRRQEESRAKRAKTCQAGQRARGAAAYYVALCRVLGDSAARRHQH